MAERMTDHRAIRLALRYAIDWEECSIDSATSQFQAPDPETQAQIDQYQRNIAAFKRVLDKYFGGARPRKLPTGKAVSLRELLAADTPARERP